MATPQKYDVYLHQASTSLAGHLIINSLRGKTSMLFAYDDTWLARPDAFALDPELPLTSGIFSPAAASGMFGCFSDCTPDRWGRTLLLREEQKSAAEEKRTPRTLSDIDFMFKSGDFARIGAFVFCPEGTAFAAPQAAEHEVPPLLCLRELMDAALDVSAAALSPAAASIRLLLAPGSSLGGARPKANVLTPEGRLTIAKFSSAQDDWDVPLWEYVALRIAQRCGIRTPPFSLKKLGGRSVLLLERFDRNADGTRRHFASAMTLLGAQDGEHASYEDIAAVIMEQGAATTQDLQELWRRMVLNICINNVDDHLRNHGFLRGGAGWELSPVYDLEIAPVTLKARALHTFISSTSNACSLELALDVAENFALSLNDARGMMRTCLDASAHWQAFARVAGASKRDCDLLADSFLDSSAMPQ